jgi:PPOX class probable F420-dependent enzyme
VELERALAYLAGQTKGVLVTIRRDGRPQLSNIMYWYDGGEIHLSVTETRAKTVNARRDPRVSLHVTSDDFWSWAVVDGEAVLSPTAAEPGDATTVRLRELYRAISGDEHPDWDEYDQAMVADRRLVLTVRPERAYGQLP